MRFHAVQSWSCFLLAALVAGSASASSLSQPGVVESHQKISDTEGDFTGILNSGDQFGSSLALLGDLDGDGVSDLAVGAVDDDADDGGEDHGAVWILFLNPDGTVKSHQKISETEGGFTGDLDSGDRFGGGLAATGDLDGDGVGDLAVGALLDDDGAGSAGAVWILFLDTDGTVKSHQEISDTEGNFLGVLSDEDFFGTAVATLEDLNGDGVVDLAVGAVGDDEGGATNLGSVWILFLATDGTVSSHQKISELQGNFGGDLDDLDLFGQAVASLGDLDGDGLTDLAVGSVLDDDGGLDQGAVWLLFLNGDGTVKSIQKISETDGNFIGALDTDDRFGWALESLGDLDGDLDADLAVGAILDDDGGSDRGAAWVLFLDKPKVPATSRIAGIATLLLMLAALTICLLSRSEPSRRRRPYGKRS